MIERIKKDFDKKGILFFADYFVHFYLHYVYNYLGYWKRKYLTDGGYYMDRPWFEYRGKIYEYHYSPYALAWWAERVVEVPVARELLSKYNPGEVLEVGNVLSHHLKSPHTVVDLFERAPGVINEDIRTYSPDRKYKLILCISTLEHMGCADHDGVPVCEHGPIIDAVENMTRLLDHDGVLVATMPVGQNPALDRLNQTGMLFDEIHYMKRMGFDEWKESEPNWNIKYNDPYPCANALVIGYRRKKT